MCPDGTLPCSNVTSPENTICYPSDTLAENCPITEVMFVKKAEITNYAINQTVERKVWFNTTDANSTNSGNTSNLVDSSQ